MNLAIDRFFKGNTRFPYKGPSTTKETGIITAQVYSYETNNAIYDVLVFENGLKAYRKNMGPMQSTIDAIKPVHYEVERHFKL